MPVKFRPYKLFLLSCITNKGKKPKILTLVLTKYIDNISYNRIFNFLYESHGFKPKIVHSGFEQAIEKALNENKNINNGLIHSRCFFHFSKMIRSKLEKNVICTKKLNKLSYEIISNIEQLCFIQLNKIKEFLKIILEKLSNLEKIKKFIKYLKEYLFEINPHIYNYTELFNYFKTNNSNLYLEKIYTTNNICESINKNYLIIYRKKQLIIL